MAAIAYQALDEKKGEDIKILEISEISVLADYFIIASGNSKPQLQALVDNVQEKLNQAGCHVKRVEGNRGSSWNLLDYGDLVVHIFDREDRLFFDLERIWSDGKLIDPETL
jgi:ribosome-associated protein